MKIPSGTLIRKNVLVDPFMADFKTIVILEPARYLLRALVLADQHFDQDPGAGFDAIPGLLTSVQSKLMSLLGSITPQPTIASKFPADRGFMNPDNACNVRLFVSCFHK